MSTFGKGQEVTGVSRKYYTGVENFKIVALNPTKEELEKIYNTEIKYTPEYTSETEVEDADGKRTVRQIRLDFFIANEDNSVTTKIQFYIPDTYQKAASGNYRVINNFGKTAWLSEEEIKSRQVKLENMQWYNTSGMNLAKKNEEELIKLLINLLNIPYKLKEGDDESEAYAYISKEDWDKIMTGDVSFLRGIIESTNNKVGVYLGVKTKGDGSLVQTTFTGDFLRQYVLSSKKENKFSYILKSIKGYKDRGLLGNVDFREKSPNLSKYSVEPTKIDSENTNQEDLFGTSNEVEESDDWLA